MDLVVMSGWTGAEKSTIAEALAADANVAAALAYVQSVRKGES
jgi:hypothetical protein